MMKYTNMKQIGCLVCVAILLVGVSGCADKSVTTHHETIGFSVDDVGYHACWHRVPGWRGQDALSFLTVHRLPMTSQVRWNRNKICVPMHPDSEKVVAKTETVYVIHDKAIVFEQGFQELGIDATRLNSDISTFRNYLYPILEKMIREHVSPQEPETEEQNDPNGE